VRLFGDEDIEDDLYLSVGHCDSVCDVPVTGVWGASLWWRHRRRPLPVSRSLWFSVWRTCNRCVSCVSLVTKT